MRETIEQKMAEHAESKAASSLTQRVIRSFFAFLFGGGALAIMVILALRDSLTAMLAAVLGVVVLLAGSFVSQTVVAGLLKALPDLMSKAPRQ